MVLSIAVFYVVLGAVANAFPFENRVVNGTDAREGEFPYIVSLSYYGGYGCGASILDSTHILTAAHCVDRRVATAFSIKYGSIYLDAVSPTPIQVQSYEVHPNYSPGGQPAYPNDLAVLTLVSAIPFSNNTKPTLMPKQGTTRPIDAPAILVGWGYYASGGTVMRTLQKVSIICYSDDNCERVHGAKVNRKYNVCGGVPEGGKGQCSGDSGGPLTVNGVQVGIVSWSVKPCAIAPYPGVYANVASYTDWICSRANCTMG